jgi:prepilin-type N-terminal cleavage/methylation domain-containing protein
MEIKMTVNHCPAAMTSRSFAMDRTEPVGGFTLVELLVTVAIIAILIALLAPALERAVYEAQFVVCGSKLKTGAISTVIYAMDHKRAYPYRGGVQDPDGDLWHPSLLRNGSTGALITNAITTNPNAAANDPGGAYKGTEQTTVWDDRPVLRTYMNLNATLNDPLNVGDLDFEGSHDDSHIFAGYELWLGFQYAKSRQPYGSGSAQIGHTQSGRGGQGMFRVGNRLEYAGRFYSVLMSDRATERKKGEDNSQTNHMDYDHTMVEAKFQDGNHPYAQTGPIAKMTYGTWWHPDPGVRGLVDLNFAYDNGSVQSFRAVKPIVTVDDRMEYVPQTKWPETSLWSSLPRE